MSLHTNPSIYLIVAAFLLATGVYGLLRRRTLVGMLIAGELILAAASLNAMALSHFYSPSPAKGQIFVLFVMALAAAEVAIGLSLVIAVYRNYRSIQAKELSQLEG